MSKSGDLIIAIQGSILCRKLLNIYHAPTDMAKLSHLLDTSFVCKKHISKINAVKFNLLVIYVVQQQTLYVFIIVLIKLYRSISAN